MAGPRGLCSLPCGASLLLQQRGGAECSLPGPTLTHCTVPANVLPASPHRAPAQRKGHAVPASTGPAGSCPPALWTSLQVTLARPQRDSHRLTSQEVVLLERSLQTMCGTMCVNTRAHTRLSYLCPARDSWRPPPSHETSRSALPVLSPQSPSRPRGEARPCLQSPDAGRSPVGALGPNQGGAGQPQRKPCRRPAVAGAPTLNPSVLCRLQSRACPGPASWHSSGGGGADSHPCRVIPGEGPLPPSHPHSGPRAACATEDICTKDSPWSLDLRPWRSLGLRVGTWTLTVLMCEHTHTQDHA